MNDINRQAYNRFILEHLEDIVERYPDSRFGQILNNLQVVSDTELFYEEPDETLTKINKNKKPYKETE